MHRRLRLSRFARDSRGSLSVEAAIMIPTLWFAIFLMFSVFDIFRYDATNSKAAYTIGDLLSRETDPVDQAFIDGMHDMFDYMVLRNEETWIRVTVVRFDGDDDELKLVWSKGSTGTPALTNDTSAKVMAAIPDMSEEDTVIVVETYMTYSTPVAVGLADFGFHNIVITRPRFASQLCWLSCNTTS